jgi:predicted hydrocarbon binding protein
MGARSVNEISIPAQTLSQLRRSLREEVGPLSAIQALHGAGYATGDLLFESFSEHLNGPAAETGADALWSSLSEFFATRGWGSLVHESLHPAIGVLRSEDWAEADPSTESQPSCAFSTGLLSSLLSRVAGGPVAVLEVECRSRGDAACAFAFGSEPAIQHVYARLLEGADLEEAVSTL